MSSPARNPGRDPSAPFPPRRVDLDAIDRELAGLLDPPAEDAEPGAQPVTRACMSNLIIYCDGEDEAERVVRDLPVLVERHPSRVLLLVGASEAHEGDLEATVSAQCYAAGGDRQVCSEHVRLSARPRARGRLPSLTRPLLVGDLPTAVWWSTGRPPPLAGALFGELAEMAGRVIYDSVGWPDPVRGVIAAADWALAPGAAAAADLAWSRLEGWRRVIAESLDPGVRPGALGAVREITMEHGPHALPVAWLLCGWLTRGLGWRPRGGAVEPGSEVAFRFGSAGGEATVRVRRLREGDPEVCRVAITAGDERIDIRESGPGRLCVRGGRERERAVPAGCASRAELLAAELAERHGDPVFRDALETARTMAKALSG